MSIITAQRSILGECADIDNPANWLVISEDSYLLLTILDEGHTHLDNLYSFLFNGKGILIFRTDNAEQARETIIQNGLKVIAEEQLTTLV